MPSAPDITPVMAYADSPKSPREVLSTLAGKSSWHAPDGGHSTAPRAVSGAAALQMGLSWAARQSAAGRDGAAVAMLLATGDLLRVHNVALRVQPRVQDALRADDHYRRLLHSPARRLAFMDVVAHVVYDMNVCRGPNPHGRRRCGMRRQHYIELYRAAYAEVDRLAQAAEADAVRYLW